MNLNLGASIAKGEYRGKSWVNFDILSNKGINVIGDMLTLPFKDNSFSKIHCVHVLEHLTRDKYFPALREMFRVIKPTGTVYVEVPDFEMTVEALYRYFDDENWERVHVYTTSIYGKNERFGMAHHWGFHEKLLRDKMIEAGARSVARLEDKEDMISGHWKQEPILLMCGVK